MFTPVLVYLLAWLVYDYTKATRPVFTKFGGKVVYGPWKKLLDFSGNPYILVS